MMWYLASPYTMHPEGHQAAADDIAEQTTLLLNAGVWVISPICHSHPLIRFGIDDDSHAFWMWWCGPLMEACDGLIVCRLPGWEESEGVSAEIGAFQMADKPIVFMEPGEIPRGL